MASFIFGSVPRNHRHVWTFPRMQGRKRLGRSSIRDFAAPAQAGQDGLSTSRWCAVLGPFEPVRLDEARGKSIPGWRTFSFGVLRASPEMVRAESGYCRPNVFAVLLN